MYQAIALPTYWPAYHLNSDILFYIPMVTLILQKWDYNQYSWSSSGITHFLDVSLIIYRRRHLKLVLVWIQSCGREIATAMTPASYVLSRGDRPTSLTWLCENDMMYRRGRWACFIPSLTSSSHSGGVLTSTKFPGEAAGLCSSRACGSLLPPMRQQR